MPIDIDLYKIHVGSVWKRTGETLTLQKKSHGFGGKCFIYQLELYNIYQLSDTIATEIGLETLKQKGFFEDPESRQLQCEEATGTVRWESWMGREVELLTRVLYLNVEELTVQMHIVIGCIGPQSLGSCLKLYTGDDELEEATSYEFFTPQPKLKRRYVETLTCGAFEVNVHVDITSGTVAFTVEAI